SFVPSYIFPAFLSGPSLAFAFYDLQTDRPYDFCLRDEGGVELATLNMKMETFDVAGPPPVSERVGGGPVLVARKGWMFQIVSAREFTALIPRPGTYDLLLREEGQETLVGSLHFVFLPPEPFTEARKAAIRADPRAMKAVRIKVGCIKCHSEI